MNCPVCGSKLKDRVCRFCLITEDEIKNAQNKIVPKYRKEGKKDKIFYSNTIAKDVDRAKLSIMTVFGGVIGVNDFYVKRYVRAIFKIVSIVLLSIVSILLYFSLLYGWGIESGLASAGRIFAIPVVIAMILWVFDLKGVITGSYKMPVVMDIGDKGEQK